jgi:hypothetical protein
VEQAEENFHKTVVPKLLSIQKHSGTPTPRPSSEGDGKKTFFPPFKEAGIRREVHGGWEGSGLAEKYTGQVLAVTIGAGSQDKKRRAEVFAQVYGQWNCNKSGELRATGTFAEIGANGFSTPPVHAMATSTAYLFVGVRNERTQEGIWEEHNLGRSPGAIIPFISVLPMKTVTADGLDVQAGDLITAMVGVCDYSSAKLGGVANGEVNARVVRIKMEVD